MAKLLVLLALCILPALFTCVYGGNPFIVRGRLYCDTCRCGFETTATKYLAGATVRIECRDDIQNLKYSIEGVSGPDGTYEIVVPNDHADEFCDAVLVSSPDPECAVPNRGRDRARVIPTRANGMVGNLRFANSMGFLKKQALPGCTKLLKQYLETDEN